jgi:hypothetical protein
MSFVDYYLPYFSQWLITCPLSALLPFQSLFTESLNGDQLLSSLPFSGVLRAPALSAVCSFLVPCLLFSFVFVFGGVVVSLSRGLCWFILG